MLSPARLIAGSGERVRCCCNGSAALLWMPKRAVIVSRTSSGADGFHFLTHSKQDTTTLTSTGCMNLLRDFAFIVLFFVFLIIWLVLWLAVHVTGGFVHLFIILAVLFLILHFVRGRRTTV
jgi:Flp pilus assembly protein TadB